MVTWLSLVHTWGMVIVSMTTRARLTRSVSTIGGTNTDAMTLSKETFTELSTSSAQASHHLVPIINTRGLLEAVMDTCDNYLFSVLSQSLSFKYQENWLWAVGTIECCVVLRTKASIYLEVSFMSKGYSYDLHSFYSVWLRNNYECGRARHSIPMNCTPCACVHYLANTMLSSLLELHLVLI